MAHEFALVLDELSGLVEGFLEGLNLVVLEGNAGSLIGDLGLELLLVVEQNGNKLSQGSVEGV